MATPIAKRMPTLFSNHGGGPSFFLSGGMFTEIDKDSKLCKFLQGYRHTIPKPKAIIVFSAHWENDGEVLVSTIEKPSLYFDYYGFPQETYSLTYPAPGDPALAERILSLLQAAKIPAARETKRGWDHGLFVPLKLMYPDADVPIVEVSLLSSLDPASHIAIGRALASLRDDGVLIYGSGALTHNLGALGSATPAEGKKYSSFVDWFVHHTVDETGATRSAALSKWQSAAPNARLAHPRAEHLIPFFAALGAAEDDTAKLVFEQFAFEGVFCLHCFQFGDS